MAIVRAEHDHIGTLGNERSQQLIVLGGAALTDNDLHAGMDARPSFFQCGTLMIGCDACCCILMALLPRQSRGVPVDRLAMSLCRLDFGHHLLVASQHTVEIHHLSKETDFLTRHQCFSVLDVDHTATGLHITTYCRHTAGCTEAEVKASLTTRANHIVDTLYAQHIANLMRVGNNADRTMADSDVCKLVGHHHAALDMYVAVDETWHDVRPWIHIRR